MASPLVFSYDGHTPDPELLGWLKDGAVGGIVIFKQNVQSDEQLNEAINLLRRSSHTAIRIMIDEEGGRVRRLPDAPDSMNALRSYEDSDPAVVAAAYASVAGRLRGIGIDTLLAPVVDVGATASAWLHDRTFSDHPLNVVAMTTAVIPAIQARGVSSCAKHFPGSRAVTIDPHDDIAVDLSPLTEWEQVDAPPFRAAILAGVHMIMVGHQRMLGFDATRPACTSPAITSALLRERFGFHGLILTDDLAMGAITRQIQIEDAVQASLVAGCNLVLVCQDRDLQRRALASWRDWTGSQQRLVGE